MLEYLSALKTAVDTLSGILQLRKAAPDRVIFMNIVTPAFGDMSKIVDDYFDMFTKLSQAKELDAATVSEFSSNRMKLLTLRSSVRQMSRAVTSRPELERFHRFFELVDDVFGTSSGYSASSFFERHLSSGDFLGEESRYMASYMRDTIELEWTKLAAEYARLKLELSV